MTADLAQIARAAGAVHLEIMGAFAPQPGDAAPDGCKTIVLLGPAEPGFWAHVTAQPEFADGTKDPLDRWSRRIVGDLAQSLTAAALFPFGGPPYQPFIRWALASGRAWLSPVGLLVHERAGLMVSYRGALAFDHEISVTPGGLNPCNSCAARPCLSACPVGALSAAPFDAVACHDYLETVPGQDCLTGGCK
ncbi:MAG: ferredoxin, partial [Alphaproteobacteria bacterium]|nr:ferredoxin [Alphaproteobacteria bacterium]